MTLELIHILRIAIIAIIAYIPTVTLAGYFEAWLSKKVGDDIPEQLGFLSFDPGVHFSLFGFGLMMSGILFGHVFPFLRGMPGWGRYIPVTPGVIMGRWRNTRIALDFMARSIGHFLLLLATFFLLVILVKISFLSKETLLMHNATSVAQAVYSLMLFFFRQNMILFIIYFIVGAVNAVMYLYFPDFANASMQNVLIILGITIAALMLGSSLLEYMVSSLFASLDILFLG